MGDGLYLSNDRYQQLTGDLFEQDARQTLGDVWEQQASAAAPDMIRQAQQDDQQRQAAIDAQRQQDQQAQQNALADQFTAAAPGIAAQHVANLTGDPDLAAHLGNALASPSPQDALQPPPAADTSQTPPVDSGPAPAAVQSQPAPLAPVTAPLPNPPTAPQQPIGQTTGVQVDPSNPEAFIRSIAPAAQAAAAQLGVPAEALIGMAANETGFGRFAAGNNLFGIKGQGPAGSISSPTWEDYGNGPVNITDAFRAYHDPSESFQDFANLISGAQRYAGVLGQNTVEGFVGALKQGGYMTDPNYVGKISNIVKTYAPVIQDALSGAGQAVQGAGQAVSAAVRNPQSILDAAKPFLGQAYVWGGKSPQQGFDCSGLAGYLTTGQAESTTSLYGKSASVGADQAQPGDLVFWNMGSSDPHLQHVAVYLGNGQIVQSGGDQAAVNVGSVNQSIGSPPEFRRVGPGGAPAQAVAAPPGAPSPADTAPTQQPSTNPLETFKQKLGDAFSDLLAPLQNLFGGSNSNPPPAPEGGGYGTVPPGGVNPLAQPITGPVLPETNILNAAVNRALGVQAPEQSGLTPEGAPFPTTTEMLNRVRSEQFPSILEPNHPINVAVDLEKRYGTWMPDASMTPEDQARAHNLMFAFGGLEAPAGATFDKYGVQEGFVPPAARYDQYGVEAGFKPPTPTGDLAPSMPPTLGRDVASTLPPGSGPLAAPAPIQESTDTVQGLLGMAKAQGLDTSTFEAKVADLMPKAEPGAAANPFALETQPGPGLVPMTEEDIANHLEDLGTRYEANDARIQELENRLGGGSLGTSGVVHPAGTVGWTNAEIIEYARQNGLNPYSLDGWPQMAGDAAKIAQSKPSLPPSARQTPTQARAELSRLMAENDQIMAATDVPEGATTLYRRPTQAPSALPFDAYTGTNAGANAASVPANGAAGAGAAPTVGAPAQAFATGANQSGAAANPPTAPAGVGTPGGPLNLTPVTTGAAAPPPGAGGRGPSGPQPGQLDLGLNAPTVHPRIQELFGDAPEYRQVAQQGLDDLVQSGANPTQIGRYFAGLERNAGVNQPQLSIGGIGANDWFRALRNGAMAGGLQTLGHVFLNIPLQTLAAVPREALASAFRGAPEQIPASIMGLFKGYSAGWEAASQQFRYGLSGAEAVTGDLARVTPALRATNPVAETAYNALQGLVATHGVAQTFMENVGFIQKLTQQAWTIAKNEGLSGSAFADRVEQIVKNAAIDPQYSDMLATAQQYGQRMALRGAQGTLGRGARGIAQAGPLGNLLVPFESIAYNVVTRGMELTPAGILGTGADVARRAIGQGPYAAGASAAGAAAVAPISERLANNVLGLGLLAYGLDLAMHGRVVGHGPDDPTERRAWLDQGGQEDSFVVGGQPNASGQIVGGRYVSGHLFGQFFYPFATAAALTESQRMAQDKGDQNTTDIMADAVRRLGEYVSNETWLRSVSQITDALKTEGGAAQKLEALAANMAESFVPQTALFRNVEQATDPYARQAAKGDLAGRLATAYPGLAGMQPIRQSLTGEPVANPNQGLGIFAPTGRGAPDPVIQLFGNAGMGVPPPPTHVRVTSKYEMDLKPNEQRQYQDLRGQALRELTQEFVAEPDFASLPIEKQRTYLQKAMTRADDIARKQFLDAMPDDQIEQRVLAYQGATARRPFAYVGSP